MNANNDTNEPRGIVCGQAHAVLDNLARTPSLPLPLSLSIEEILERAWEHAYRRTDGHLGGTVIPLMAHTDRNRRNAGC